MTLLDQFNEIWLIDFEYQAPDGCRPNVVCMVAQEYYSGRRLEIWQDKLSQMTRAPYDTGPGSLTVAYYASAEMNCFQALGWEMPVYLLDLFTEFRCMTNGGNETGSSLLDAMVYHRLPTIGSTEKTAMRDLIMSGGPFSSDEQREIIDYCGTDVDALSRLLPVMLPDLGEHSLLRGRYMKATACMEFNGIPIDCTTLDRIKACWENIQDSLIQRIAGDYGIYEGRTFRAENFERFLAGQGIPWPRTASGGLALDKDTFKEMATAHPIIAPIHELRAAMSQMRNNKLAIGPDGRNRLMLSAFRSKTGRNQPSTSRFIYGLSAWSRALMKPDPGMGIANIDWSQQEFGIAAALSGDKAMQEAYSSGDPYLGFAKAAGAVPPDATKQSHPKERAMFKATVLGVQYSMGAENLALRLNVPKAEARYLLDLHRRSFPAFWKWSDASVDYAYLMERIHSVFGWTMRVSDTANDRAIRNFPMQANGAEMMRLAACYATEKGIRVCCPVHDAFLIEAPLPELDATVNQMQEIMKQASRDVLDGFELASDADIYRYPNRYMDKRGEKMWNTVMELLPPEDPCQLCTDTPVTHESPVCLFNSMSIGGVVV